MKKLIVLLMAMLVASVAFAQIDPDTNMMGVYLDSGASVVCMDGVAGNTPVNAYVCLVNPNFEAIKGFECTPTVFVRLTGCPLRCVWCDTEYAFSGGKILALTQILQQIKSFSCPRV